MAPVIHLGPFCGCSGAGAELRRSDTARGVAVSCVHVPARCAQIRGKWRSECTSLCSLISVHLSREDRESGLRVPRRPSGVWLTLLPR